MRDLTLEEFEAFMLEIAEAYNGEYDGLTHIKAMNKYLTLAGVDISKLDLSQKLEKVGELKKKLPPPTSKATK